MAWVVKGNLKGPKGDTGDAGVSPISSVFGRTGAVIALAGDYTVGQVTGAVPNTLTLTAGNGLTGGGTLAANRSFALGTPGTITGATTNAVQATSHTHALTLASADITGALGYTPYNSTNPSGYTSNTGTVTSVTGGNGLTGSISTSGSLALGTPGTLSGSTTNAVQATSHTHALSANLSTWDSYSAASGMVYKGSLGGGVDLNTITETGWYHQNSNANAGSGVNYPTIAAGLLEVYSASSMVYQTYSHYLYNIKYIRSYYNGSWKPWAEIWSAASFDPATKADDSAVVHTTGNESITGVKSFVNTISGNISGSASNVRDVSIVAGNGLTGGGVLSGSKTITLGTPGTLTGATTNAVTSTSHTHALSANLSAWDGIAPSSKMDKAGDYFTGNFGYDTGVTTAPRMRVVHSGDYMYLQSGLNYSNNVGRFRFTGWVGDTLQELRMDANSVNVKGNEVWHAGNFDPSNKVNSNSPTFLGGYFSLYPYSAAHVGTHNGRMESYVSETVANSPVWKMYYKNSANAIQPFNLEINGNYYAGSNAVWHAGNLLNIGTTAATARSALGLGSAATLAATTAHTAYAVAQRDNAGDVHARLFRMNYSVANANVQYIMTCVDPSGGDNYIRPSTPAQVKSALSIGYGDISGTIPDAALASNGVYSFSQLRLSSTTDASLTSTTHAFQIGATNSANIVIDTNEIIARNNGAISTLNINLGGGATSFGGNVNIASGGLSLGSTVASSAASLADHIMLYSTSYGINVTTNTINIKANAGIFSFNSSGIATGVNWVATSDARLKNIIGPAPVKPRLADLLELFDFTWKDTGLPGRSPIAQHVQRVAPEYVYEKENGELGIDKASLALDCVIGLAKRVAELERKYGTA